jgi:hypothetical protein
MFDFLTMEKAMSKQCSLTGMNMFTIPQSC